MAIPEARISSQPAESPDKQALPQKTQSAMDILLPKDLGPIVVVKKLRRVKAPQKDEVAFGGKRASNVLIGAYGDDKPMLLVWKRHQFDGSIDLVTAGSSIVGENFSDHERVLTYPPGARGKEIDTQQLIEELEDFPKWRRIAGTRRPPGIGTTRDSQDELKEFFGSELSFENNVLPSYRNEFAYILQPSPFSPDDIQELYMQEARKWRAANDLGGEHHKQKQEADRINALATSLSQAETSGYWKVNILVGAKDEAHVNQLSRTIATASITDQPYIYAPGKTIYDSIHEAVTASLEDKEAKNFHSTTFALSTLFAYPETEVAGVEISERASFDKIIEGADQIPEDQIIDLGIILDDWDNPAGSLVMDRERTVMHMLVTGSTGKGKSSLIRRELIGLAKQEIPWLIVDPKVGGDYDVMGAILKDPKLKVPEKHQNVYALRPGDESQPAIGINPLEPQSGITIRKHIPQLHANLLSAFGHEPGQDDREAAEVTGRHLMDALTGRPDDGIKGLYEEFGFDLDSPVAASRFGGDNPPCPTMIDLMWKCYDVVSQLGYTGDAENVQRWIKQRIGYLTRGGAGRFFNGQPLSVEKMLASNTLVQLEEVKSPVDRALIGLTLYTAVDQHTAVQERQRSEGGQNKLRFVMGFEEANEFVEEGPLADMIGDSFATVRQRGVALLLSTQNVHRISKRVIGNTDHRFAFGQNIEEDIKAMTSPLKLNEEQQAYLGTMDQGRVIYFKGGMDGPILAQVHNPKDLPNTKGDVLPAYDLMKKKATDAFTEEEINKAQDELRDTDHGKLLTGWADIAVTTALLGLSPVEPDDDWCRGKGRFEFDDLREMDSRIRDCAITEAVTEAVNSKNRTVEIVKQKGLSRADLIQHITQTIKLQLAEQEIPEDDRTKFQLDAYKYLVPQIQVEAWIHNMMQSQQVESKGEIPPHPKTEMLNEMLGVEIMGETALEQYEFLEKMAKRTKADTTKLFFTPHKLGKNIIDQAIGDLPLKDAITRDYLQQQSGNAKEAEHEVARLSKDLGKTIENFPEPELAARLSETFINIKQMRAVLSNESSAKDVKELVIAINQVERTKAAIAKESSPEVASAFIKAFVEFEKQKKTISEHTTQFLIENLTESIQQQLIIDRSELSDEHKAKAMQEPQEKMRMTREFMARQIPEQKAVDLSNKIALAENTKLDAIQNEGIDAGLISSFAEAMAKHIQILTTPTDGLQAELQKSNQEAIMLHQLIKKESSEEFATELASTIDQAEKAKIETRELSSPAYINDFLESVSQVEAMKAIMSKRTDLAPTLTKAVEGHVRLVLSSEEVPPQEMQEQEQQVGALVKLVAQQTSEEEADIFVDEIAQTEQFKLALAKQSSLENITILLESVANFEAQQQTLAEKSSAEKASKLVNGLTKVEALKLKIAGESSFAEVTTLVNAMAEGETMKKSLTVQTSPEAVTMLLTSITELEDAEEKGQKAQAEIFLARNEWMNDLRSFTYNFTDAGPGNTLQILIKEYSSGMDAFSEKYIK